MPTQPRFALNSQPVEWAELTSLRFSMAPSCWAVPRRASPTQRAHGPRRLELRTNG